MKKDDKIIKLFDEEGNEVSFNVVAFFDIVNEVELAAVQEAYNTIFIDEE